MARKIISKTLSFLEHIVLGVYILYLMSMAFAYKVSYAIASTLGKEKAVDKFFDWLAPGK